VGNVLGTLRRNGNSVVVTIPPEELARLGVRLGDMVDIQIRPVEIRPKLTPSVAAALEVELVNGREALDYLGTH
jgi:antitoxin component of MazEF toxin-antitoxin module